MDFGALIQIVTNGYTNIKQKYNTQMIVELCVIHSQQILLMNS